MRACCWPHGLRFVASRAVHFRRDEKLSPWLSRYADSAVDATAGVGADAPKKIPLSPLRFWLLAIVIGLVGGCGAVVFRGMIAFFHNLFFLGKISCFYDANVHTPPSPWGPLIIFVPVIGAIGVTWLVQTFAPEARGHGVPEVMDAIYYNKSIIRPIVAVIKSLASALSIGSGGSVGREGPIIQIGSAFGSTVGQWLRIPAWQRTTLIAAGAGAGIAATFNTPIGGVLFAAELLLHEISVWTLVPVVICDRERELRRALFLRTEPGLRHSAVADGLLPSDPSAPAPRLRRTGSAHRPGLGRLHPLDLRLRGFLRREDSQSLSAPHERHAPARHSHVSAPPSDRGLSHRRGRLCHDPAASSPAR